MFWIISSDTSQKAQLQAKVVAREVRRSAQFGSMPHDLAYASRLPFIVFVMVMCSHFLSETHHKSLTFVGKHSAKDPRMGMSQRTQMRLPSLWQHPTACSSFMQKKQYWLLHEATLKPKDFSVKQPRNHQKLCFFGNTYLAFVSSSNGILGIRLNCKRKYTPDSNHWNIAIWSTNVV